MTTYSKSSAAALHRAGKSLAARLMSDIKQYCDNPGAASPAPERVENTDCVVLLSNHYQIVISPAGDVLKILKPINKTKRFVRSE